MFQKQLVRLQQKQHRKKRLPKDQLEGRQVELPQEIVSIFFIYGILSFSATVLIVGFFLRNYLKYKSIFYSEKDIEIHFLKKALEEKTTTIKTLEHENNEITELIIGRLK